MILLLHITIALSSLGYTSYLYVKPSQRGLRIGTWLIGGTLASGTALVLSTGENMLRACVSGLVYLAIVSLGMYAAQRKLTAQSE